MERKELGKINSVRFGYWEFMFGLHLELGGSAWGTMTSYDYNPSYKGDITYVALKMLNDIQSLLKSAKVDSVEKLKNIPIEATFEDNLLKGFRVLEEVL